MPKELLHIPSGIVWLRTTIRPVGGWLQTELYFQVDGQSLSVAFDTLPDTTFLKCVTSIRTLRILDEDAGAVEGAADRYDVRIRGGEPLVEVTASSSYVRYGPLNSA